MGDIALRGQGRAFLQRKRFAEGSGPEKIEIGEGKIGGPVVVTPEEMDKLLNPPEVKIPKIPSDKEIAGVSKSVEDFKKKEKQEPKLQFRCQGPNQEKKCGHRDEKKKGGSTTPIIPPALKKGMKKIGLKNGGQTKVGKVMREFGKGKLHSGSKKGPVVKSRKQAIAIALSEAGKSKK